MLTTVSLLDTAKAAQTARDQRPCSDYRLCKLLGLSDSAVSNYRAGRSHPDDQIAAGLAAIAELDVHEVLAWIQAERSRDAASKNLWMEIAEKLADANNGKGKGKGKRPAVTPGPAPLTFRDLPNMLRLGLVRYVN